jgi:hypothetical protein
LPRIAFNSRAEISRRLGVRSSGRHLPRFCLKTSIRRSRR